MSLLLEAAGLEISSPAGRPLFRDLHLSMGAEKAAIIGRNGSGKSTLLSVLAGLAPARSGALVAQDRWLVPQTLTRIPNLARFDETLVAHEAERAGLRGALDRCDLMSAGELRKLHLIEAKLEGPSVLLLDEPSEDLDAQGLQWLLEWIRTWPSAALLVSHDRRLLSLFSNFFIVSESGCRYVPGDMEEVERHLERARLQSEKRYLSRLQNLDAEERHHRKVSQRRARKKQLGRIHEEGRCPTKAQLKGNKGYAQMSQGRAKKIRDAKRIQTQDWARAARRAVAVELPLSVVIPQLTPDDGAVLLQAEGLSARSKDRALFGPIDLRLSRADRLAITGPNGAGKTTLLRAMLGQERSDLQLQGRASAKQERIGMIEQGAANWMRSESLLQWLSLRSALQDLDAAAQAVAAHRFPFALANRPLDTLSPGERTRAALICLFAASTPPELLILDEPSCGLDFVGAAALTEVLRAWPGGLVVVSHDSGFLDGLHVQRRLHLE